MHLGIIVKIYLQHNSTTQKAISNKKRVKSDFAMTIWCFWKNDCEYVLLLQFFWIAYTLKLKVAHY